MNLLEVAFETYPEHVETIVASLIVIADAGREEECIRAVCADVLARGHSPEIIQAVFNCLLPEAHRRIDRRRANAH